MHYQAKSSTQYIKMAGVRIQTEQLHSTAPIFPLQYTLKMVYGLQLIYQVQYTPKVLLRDRIQ